MRAKIYARDPSRNRSEARRNCRLEPRAGLIALLTVFAHPEDYQVCYAGVPVSDLEERIKIKGKGYEELFSAPYHIGKTVAEAPEEYRRRSPKKNVNKLRTALASSTPIRNDEDVNIHEIQKLIEALQNRAKDFSCRIYTNAPAATFLTGSTRISLANRAKKFGSSYGSI